MTLTNAEKAYVFRSAAAAIDEFGWEKEVFQRGKNGPMCIAGAVSHALTGEARQAWIGLASELNQELAVIMRDRLGLDCCMERHDFPWPAGWNNTIARDADEVIHVLKMAAEEIELQED